MNFEISTFCRRAIHISDKVPLGVVPTYEGKHGFLLYGIGQVKETSAKEVCGKNPILLIETESDFVDGLISTISMGIYTPRTVRIYCKIPH